MEVKEKVSLLEIEHRRTAARMGAASCALEGIVVSADNVREKELVERWINGEITSEEFMNAPV